MSAFIHWAERYYIRTPWMMSGYYTWPGIRDASPQEQIRIIMSILTRFQIPRLYQVHAIFIFSENPQLLLAYYDQVTVVYSRVNLIVNHQSMNTIKPLIDSVLSSALLCHANKVMAVLCRNESYCHASNRVTFFPGIICSKNVR